MTTTQQQNLQNAVLALADSAKMDQDEAIAAARALEATCAELRSKLPSGVAIAAPQSNGDVLAYLGHLAHHKAALQAALNHKPTAAPNTKVSKGMTLTDKVLAARGVKSLAELQQTFRESVHD